MKYDFVVIGANGIQGKIVSKFLLKDEYSVLLCAINDYGIEKLIEHPKANFRKIDLRRMDKVKRVVEKSGSSVLINCALDDYNFFVTRMSLELGMNYIDLGSEEMMYYEQFKLGEEFKKKGLIGITGIGSTPGITNVMLRYVKDEFDTIDTVHLGFAWNSNKKTFVSPFSIDAIACEFTELAKILEKGKYIERMPDTCLINYRYKSIGRQKTQYTKHIEHHTFYDFLKDKGIKNIAVLSSFPRHSRSAIMDLMSLGFMSKEELDINGTFIRPLDFTIEVLRRILVPEGYSEKENLFLKVYGIKNKKKKFIEMDCLAGTLLGWEDATCNVDTGFPTAILGEMVLRGEILEKGMFSPEFIVPPEPFFKRLGENKIWIYKNGKRINVPK